MVNLLDCDITAIIYCFLMLSGISLSFNANAGEAVAVSLPFFKKGFFHHGKYMRGLRNIAGHQRVKEID